MELSLPATQLDSDSDEEAARPADAARVEASPTREFDMAMDDSSAEDVPMQVDVGSSERQWVSRVPVENRFQVLSGQESDTESCEVSDRRRHRRLRLIWNPPGEGATPREPLRFVVARRIGVVQPGDPVPRAIRQQRWSPLNVPLMWAAAGGDANHPVLEWLENAARRVQEPMEFHGNQTTAEAAVREGWIALRSVLTTWGVTSQEQLTEWMVRQGLPRVSVGNHIAARAQELILEEAATVDARVALLEAAYVKVTIQVGRELTAGEPSHRVPIPRAEPRRPIAPSISADSWEQLDHIDLGEAFTTRVPMLRSCPRFLRGRLRFSLGVALRERSRAKLARDPVAETRAWKLFGLIPMLLLHRPRHSGIVGRDELTSLQGQAAERLAEMTGGMVP